jgi:hypothetical protein
MKRLIPGKSEFSILAAMALGIALLASLTLPTDAALALGSVPLFIASCLMGMRRNGQLTRRD